MRGSSLLGQFWCASTSLPQPVADSGFPDGFLSSFSYIGVDLSDVSLSIPEGYRMSGTFNILGLEASAELNVRWKLNSLSSI